MALPWLTELNDAQREAVTHGDGPLLVIAGAGTGKTKTLACRAAYLVQNGIDPERILLLTFTRRAAGEMIDRAKFLADDPAVHNIWGGTFHAVANRLLRQYGRAVGLSADFTVMDASDAAAGVVKVTEADIGDLSRDIDLDVPGEAERPHVEAGKFVWPFWIADVEDPQLGLSVRYERPCAGHGDFVAGCLERSR